MLLEKNEIISRDTQNYFSRQTKLFLEIRSRDKQNNFSRYVLEINKVISRDKFSRCYPEVVSRDQYFYNHMIPYILLIIEVSTSKHRRWGSGYLGSPAQVQRARRLFCSSALPWHRVSVHRLVCCHDQQIYLAPLLVEPSVVPQGLLTVRQARVKCS